MQRKTDIYIRNSLLMTVSAEQHLTVPVFRKWKAFCTVNGKSTTVSYKVHKKIEKYQDDYQIIPNSQEFMRIIFSVSYPMSVIPVWQMNTKLSKSDLYQRLRKMKKLSLNFKSKLLI